MHSFFACAYLILLNYKENKSRLSESIMISNKALITFGSKGVPSSEMII